MSRNEKSISQEKSIIDTTTKGESNIQKFKLYFDFIDKKNNDKNKMQEKEQDKDIVVVQIEIIDGKGETGIIKKSISKSVILENINEIKFDNRETSSNYKNDNNSYSFKITKTNINEDDSRSKSYYYIIYLFTDEKKINIIDDIQSPKELKFIFNLENDMRKVEIENLKNEMSLLNNKMDSLNDSVNKDISSIKDDLKSLMREHANQGKTVFFSTHILEVSTVGIRITSAFPLSLSFKKSDISLASSATRRRHCCPYRSWLPTIKYSFFITCYLRKVFFVHIVSLSQFRLDLVSKTPKNDFGRIII